MVAPWFSTPADFAALRKTSDVVLRSSDGCEFPCRKLFLSAASPVFEDMFEGDKTLSTDLKSHDGIPIVSMAETANELEMFLRFTHRELGRPRDLSFDSVTTLLQMGDKYQNKSITSAATSYLFSHVKSESLLVFSIAVAYQNLEIARLALGQIPLAQRSLHKVPIEYLRRFTIQAIQSFCRIKEGESESGHVSMYGRRSWDDLVLEFTF